MNMKSQENDGRPSTPDHTPSLSASATAVNSPATPQFPQRAALSDTPSFMSSSLSTDDDEEDDDESSSEEDDLPVDSIPGWPRLAQVMAKTPDFAAFPRFRDLNVKSLLYYQCELKSLGEKLHELERHDQATGKPYVVNTAYAEYADDLVEDGIKSDQFKAMQDIRKVLKEYNEALLQYSQICALPGPEPFNMRTLRNWLRHERCGDGKVRDRYGPVDTWGKLRKNPEDNVGSLWSQFRKLLLGFVWPRPPKSELDLALTAPHTQVDGLTHWVASELIPFGRALKKQRKPREDAGDVEKNAEKKKKAEEKARRKSQENTVVDPTTWVSKVKKEKTLASWSESSALRFTSGISTVVACLLPVIAISVLSQLHGLEDLLLCLAGFALVFAVGLIALTQGTSKRTEIFGATAAFSAVMVVFISIPPAPVIVMPPGSSMPSVSPSAVVSLR